MMLHDDPEPQRTAEPGKGAPPKGRLLEIHVLYCNEDDGTVRKLVLKPGNRKIGGLVWTKGINKPPTSSNKKTPLPPGQPTGDTCKDMGFESVESDPTCCYWNGSEWICPDAWS